MFGDCQLVMSSMIGGGGGGGNGIISSESLFSAPIQNPSFDFMSSLPLNMLGPVIPKEEETWMMLGGGKEELLESGGSGSEQMVMDREEISVNEPPSQDGKHQPPKKKRYHRHTIRQIQEMEALFKECQHPDDKQRMRLSQELGLKPRQVKFWFQNRRTQMKAQRDRTDNAILRAENEDLKSDNYSLQAMLRSVICTNCGRLDMPGEAAMDEQQLHQENMRLKGELERICCLASRYDGLPMQLMPPLPPPPSLDLEMNIFSRNFPIPTAEPMTSSDTFPMSLFSETSLSHLTADVGPVVIENEKPMALELAVSSVDELVKMCRACEPLWVINGKEGGRETLDFDEYSRLFPWPNLKNLEMSGEFRREASRDSAVVIMSSVDLVDAFLNANKWMELFPSIVARAKTIQVITSGISGNESGSLHLMYAELQLPSPLVPSRETYFLRYCHQNVEEGSWAVVDFPMDSFLNSLPPHPPLPRYRRRPSGCIIQDMPSGYSRVTWVEHAEIEEKPVHPLFSQLVSSGWAFGSRRWLAVLQRQCERVASHMAQNISNLGVIPTPEVRKNLMRLAQQMTRTFCVNISASGGQCWTALSDCLDDSVRITTRKIAEPGQPNGVVLGAVSSTWLPCSHHQVFDLLKDERRRSLIDVISNGNDLQEVANIANGSHPRNCISLLRINAASNSSQDVELLLQESCTDQSGSLIVYSTIDMDSIQLAMSGEDPSCIPLLPIGFVVVPTNSTANPAAGMTSTDGKASEEEGRVNPTTGGCLLTIGLQVLASANPTAKLSLLSTVSMITGHLCNTVQQINQGIGNVNIGDMVGDECPENDPTSINPE